MCSEGRHLSISRRRLCSGQQRKLGSGDGSLHPASGEIPTTQLLLIGQSNVSKRWLLLLRVSKISTNLFSGPAKDGVSVRVLGHDNDGPANFLPTGKVNDHFHS